MSLKAYLKYRKTGLRHRPSYELSEMDRFIDRIMSGLFIVGVLFALILIYDWMLERDMAESNRKVEYHRASEDKAIRALATCLNGGVVKIDDIALFCDRAVEQRGL